MQGSDGHIPSDPFIFSDRIHQKFAAGVGYFDKKSYPQLTVNYGLPILVIYE